MTDYYDYLKVTVEDGLLSQYLDGYMSFGWRPDENVPQERGLGRVTLHLKRSRSVPNKVELTRLQRHYEACMREVAALEASKASVPAMVSVGCGVIGCAFMAGSVFAVTAATPIIWLMVLLGIPGFAFWGAAYFGYRVAGHRRAATVAPLIDAKYDEAYAVCEKAQRLLGE